MSTRHTHPNPASRIRAVLRLAGGSAIVLTFLFGVRIAPAAAQDFSLHVEPAAALWLKEPQTDRFSPGLYAALRPSLALGRIASLQLSYAYLFTPADDDFEDAGAAHLLTVGLRVRPLARLQPEHEQLGGLWADFNTGYARTGELDRFTFDVGVGYGFQVAPTFALGPAVRYVQIIDSSGREGFDTSDARALTLGANFSFGPVRRDEEVVERVIHQSAPAAECVEQECVQDECVQEPCPTLPTSTCVDTDGDGICDNVDRCPLQPGPASTFGCPTDPCDGTPLRVRVQFDHDSAAMPVVRTGDDQTMDPVLDAVAEAISQNPTCRVGILGHASEEGGVDHNQRLSESRANAVRSYMIERGIDAELIPSHGMGDRCQLSPERSRVLNRRVEFFRLEQGEQMPTECLP